MNSYVKLMYILMSKHTTFFHLKLLNDRSCCQIRIQHPKLHKGHRTFFSSCESNLLQNSVICISMELRLFHGHKPPWGPYTRVSAASVFLWSIANLGAEKALRESLCLSYIREYWHNVHDWTLTVSKIVFFVPNSRITFTHLASLTREVFCVLVLLSADSNWIL